MLIIKLNFSDVVSLFVKQNFERYFSFWLSNSKDFWIAFQKTGIFPRENVVPGGDGAKVHNILLKSKFSKKSF